MAKSDAVWGIDIGNAGIKAIRCRPSEDAEQVEAFAVVDIAARGVIAGRALHFGGGADRADLPGIR